MYYELFELCKCGLQVHDKNCRLLVDAEKEEDCSK